MWFDLDSGIQFLILVTLNILKRSDRKKKENRKLKVESVDKGNTCFPHSPFKPFFAPEYFSACK